MFVLDEGKLTRLIAPLTPMYGGGQAGEWLGIGSSELSTYSDIYRSQPAVRSVVDFMAGQLSRMPLRVYKEINLDDRAPSGDRQYLSTSPAQRLLNVPTGHRRQGRVGFWRDMWSDFLIYDRVCLAKIRDLDTGDPLALVRIPAIWFTPAGPNYFYPDKIVIQGNRSAGGFDIEDVVYIHGYDPTDPRIGTSPMQTLRSVLEEEVASVTWRRRFWEQGVQHSMIITRPDTAPQWDDDARDRFIESIRAAQNRGKPLLLEDGMSANPASGFDPKSSQYIQSKEFTREEVLRAYNLPTQLFSDQSASNAAVYKTMLYSEGLAPLLEKFTDELKTQLLTEFYTDPEAEGISIDPGIEERLRGDFAAQVELAVKATGGGAVMTRAEGRRFLRLPELPADQKADVLTMSAATKLVTDDAEAAPSENATGMPVGAPLSGNVPPDVRESRDQSQNQPPTDGSMKARTKVRQPTRARKTYTNALTKTFARTFERQAKAVASSGKFDRKRFDREVADDLKAARRPMATYFGTSAAESVDGEFDVEQTTAYLDTGAEMFASSLNESTAKALAGGAAAASVFALLSDNAAVFADDEVARIASFATAEAAKQTGALKMWIVTSDTPRASHAALDGESVAYDSEFSNGLRYPRDPEGDAEEVANCQCELTLVRA